MSTLNSIEIIQLTKALYPYPDKFEDYLTVAQNPNYTETYSRLIRWLDYFNESFYSKQCTHYQYSIEALFEIWFNNNVLIEQSGYEFDLSKQFYETFFEIITGKVFVDSVSTKKILMLSFVFSKYHGMVKKSIFNQFGNLEIVINENQINEIVKNSFVKYEVPKYLIYNFESMTSIEIEILIQAINGKIFRSHPVFLKSLTKYEFSRLISLDTFNLRFKNQIFLRGVIVVKLTKNSFSQSFLQTFISSSGTFMMFPEKYIQDIEFWKLAYELILAGLNRDEPNFITDCVDFLEYKKCQNEAPFSLKGRTPTSLFRLVREWHGYVNKLEFTILRKEEWVKSKELDLHFRFNNKLYMCKELNSGELLYSEGNVLNHCVVTYTLQCKNNVCTIWSLSKWNEFSKEYESILTLEVADKKIIQARGDSNRFPFGEEMRVVKDWSERMDYKIELIKNN